MRAPAREGITKLDLFAGIAVLADGTVVPVTTMYDADGDPTKDPQMAISFVCGEGNRWLTGKVFDADLEESW